jgi:hypothetical protein
MLANDSIHLGDFTVQARNCDRAVFGLSIHSKPRSNPLRLDSGEVM